MNARKPFGLVVKSVIGDAGVCRDQITIVSGVKCVKGGTQLATRLPDYRKLLLSLPRSRDHFAPAVIEGNSR